MSIKDPRVKYMGMHLTARAYLRGVDIDISFIGPKEKPAAAAETPARQESAARSILTIEQAIENARKNRREALLGQIVGAGIGILLFVILSKLLG